MYWLLCVPLQAGVTSSNNRMVAARVREVLGHKQLRLNAHVRRQQFFSQANVKPFLYPEVPLTHPNPCTSVSLGVDDKRSMRTWDSSQRATTKTIKRKSGYYGTCTPRFIILLFNYFSRLFHPALYHVIGIDFFSFHFLVPFTGDTWLLPSTLHPNSHLCYSFY